MALQYSPDFLLFLRDSPLCTKPTNLPPAEEWMGPPPEQQPRTQHPQTRNNNQGTAFGAFEKPRYGDNPLLDQTNRRPDLNRHASRNSATNPDDIVFGPPRMSFASSGRKTENDRSTRDGDLQGRSGNLRNKSGDFDGDKFRDGRNANPLRRRGEAGDQDSDGWSTVKPRKSFGAEGAERFHGRMGGNFRDEKRAPRDRDDRSSGRPYDGLASGRDGDDDGRLRNNGPQRGKQQETWHKNDGSESRVPEKRERIDRAKNWRERQPENEATDDHNTGRYHDNRTRWGRDQQRVEREPEWFDEPVEPKVEVRTAQDFQKWMEEMKKSKDGSAAAPKSASLPVPDPAIESAKPMRSPAVEQGPDKFFLAFGNNSKSEVTTPGEPKEAAKPKAGGKSSRFTSFFQSQDGGRSESIPGPPAALSPPNGMGLLAALSAPPTAPIPGAQPPDEERQAFQQLLAKLQKQSVSQTPPSASPYPPPGLESAAEPSQKTGPSPFQQMMGGERQDGPVGRPPPSGQQEIHAPRPQPQAARPEQLLQDLVGHHQRVSSQGSARGDGTPRNNSNTEFLMNLMRAGPGGPDSQRSESAMMRAAQHQQSQKQMMPHQAERDGDYPQDGRNSQQRAMRPPPPPGFPIDDGYRGGDAEFRQNPPTQILQRPPPPPGLDQMPPGWMGGGQMPPPPHQQQQGQPGQQQQGQQQPQHQRGPMLPPPGLAGGPGRNPPMPHMFPPNMPPMPPPDVMGGMGPRNMGPPPPGFFNGPPHGFIPPGMAGFNGPPGPDSPFAASQFEGRNMPPPAGGRGANYGRG